MELKEQVASLELSKKMKELGFPQESLFYWVNRGGGFQLQYTEVLTDCAYDDEKNGTRKDWAINYMKKFGNENYYSAYTVAELGEMLPKTIDIGKNEGYLSILPQNKNSWRIVYDWNIDSLVEFADTQADAMAKMLIYLKENNLI